MQQGDLRSISPASGVNLGINDPQLRIVTPGRDSNRPPIPDRDKALKEAIIAACNEATCMDGLRAFHNCVEAISQDPDTPKDYPWADHCRNIAITLARVSSQECQIFGWGVLNDTLHKAPPFGPFNTAACDIVPNAMRALLRSYAIEDVQARGFLQVSTLCAVNHMLKSASMIDIPTGISNILSNLADTLANNLISSVGEPFLQYRGLEISKSAIEEYLAAIANISRMKDGSDEKDMMNTMCMLFSARLRDVSLKDYADAFDLKRKEAAHNHKPPSGAVKVPLSPKAPEGLAGMNTFSTSAWAEALRHEADNIFEQNESSKQNNQAKVGGRALSGQTQPLGPGLTGFGFGTGDYKDMQALRLGEMITSLDEEYTPRDPLRDSLDSNSEKAPSTRMWLGNIAQHVNERSLTSVFAAFGGLADGAVFPGRIGPLGYAFINFYNVNDARRAFEALNNTAVPSLTGNKPLKMRFKPADEFRGNRSRPSPKQVQAQQIRQLVQENAIRHELRQNSLPVNGVHLGTNRDLNSLAANVGSLNSMSVPSYTNLDSNASQNSLLNSANPFNQFSSRSQPFLNTSDNLEVNLRNMSAPPAQHGFACQSFSSGLNSAPSTSNLSSMLDPNHRNYNPAFAKEFSALSKADCDAMWRFDAENNPSMQGSSIHNGTNRAMTPSSQMNVLPQQLGFAPVSPDMGNNTNSDLDLAGLLAQQNLQNLLGSQMLAQNGGEGSLGGIMPSQQNPNLGGSTHRNVTDRPGYDFSGLNPNDPGLDLLNNQISSLSVRNTSTPPVLGELRKQPDLSSHNIQGMDEELMKYGNLLASNASQRYQHTNFGIDQNSLGLDLTDFRLTGAPPPPPPLFPFSTFVFTSIAFS